MLTTQLGGPNLKNNTLFAVKRRLTSAGIRVIHPLNDGFFLMQGRYFTFNPRKWLRYEVDVDYYESILSTDLHIVCNETANGVIDYDAALEILFAMIHNKPIVLTNQPQLGKRTDLLIRDILGPRLINLPVLHLRAIPADSVQEALAKLPKSVDYNLSEHDKLLIKSRLKEHFRRLLHPAPNHGTFFAISRS